MTPGHFAVRDRPHCDVRAASCEDAESLSEVFRASWTNAYLGLIPHPYLDNIISRRTPDWWRCALQADSKLLVVQVGNDVAGYATFGKARVRGEYEGEIYELYMLPTYQGLGFGEALFEACRHNIDRAGLSGLVVWALADNSAASDFYWRRGGRPVGQGFECFGRLRLKKVAYAWD